MTEVFVFGSNLAGRHGKGSALEAIQKHGAIYGQGTGRQGNSYAIPTKDGRDGGSLRRPSQILSKPVIKQYVLQFLDYARDHPDDTFNVVAIGCSNSGYKPEQIGPMFRGHPSNVRLPEAFKPYV
jgi:hypothetical protein